MFAVEQTSIWEASDWNSRWLGQISNSVEIIFSPGWIDKKIETKSSNTRVLKQWVKNEVNIFDFTGVFAYSKTDKG